MASLSAAFSALESGKPELAESEIQQFFSELIDDLVVSSCRERDFDRQVFEPNYFSSLVAAEIDGWFVLSAVKMQRKDWQGARADCYRQIELIDQHYGFDSPSWHEPETRIPRHPEFTERYFRVAKNMATICTMLNETDLKSKWNSVASSAISARVNPDVLWKQWLTKGSDDYQASKLNYYHIAEWSINKVEIDHQTWSVSLYSALPKMASPIRFSLLVSVHVPTDPACDVPAKSKRWIIWSLRQALSGRLQGNDLGIFFGELQGRGERVLLFYAENEEIVRRCISPIMEAAVELSPRLQIRPDPGWLEYSKWGGSRIVVNVPVQIPDALPQEHENDLFLRQAWQKIGSISSIRSRMNCLLDLVQIVTAESDAMRNFCVDYLFYMLSLLAAEDHNPMLWEMVSKLASLDIDAARRAFDMICLDEALNHNKYEADSAALTLALLDPERALQIVRVLKKQNRRLLFKITGQIAGSIGRTDLARAQKLIAETREDLLKSSQNAFEKASYLIELAGYVKSNCPENARELLREAAGAISEMEQRHRLRVSLNLLSEAKEVDLELVKTICPEVFRTACTFMPSSKAWLNTGTNALTAIDSTSQLVQYASFYDKALALEMLTQTTEMTCELSNMNEQLDLLPRLANAAASLDIETNSAIAQRLWSLLSSLSEKCKSPGNLFLQNRRRPGSASPIESFVKMNPPIAAENVTVIITSCQLAVSPEQQVDLLASFAGFMPPDQLKIAEQLIAEAAFCSSKCSTAFLRTGALAQLAAAMNAAQLDSDEVCKKIYSTIDSISSLNTRLAAVLDAAQKSAGNSPELSNLLLKKALEITPLVTNILPSNFEQLDGLPRALSSKLFFTFLNKQKDDSMLEKQLNSFAHSFAKNK